jgi:MerR family redox-sensitive transcriptional activator SoxR
MKEQLTIREVAGRSGVAPSALRFYEERGLIHSERATSGHRRYPRDVLRRVAFIVFAQRVGLTLEDVARELSRLPPGEVPTKSDWTKLVRTWKQRIDVRIAELTRLRDSLDGCIGCGCLSLTQCHIANPEDRACRFGPGPGLWTGRIRPRQTSSKSRSR